MLNFIYNDDKLEVVMDEFNAAQIARDAGKQVVNRNDFNGLTDAEKAAKDATELTGDQHVAVDQGKHHYPRYDVVRAPKVGDEVSYAFNGDYYPCGKVTKVSASLRRVEKSEGRIFWRRKETGSWINSGTWSLIQGHVDRRNPHF